MSRTAKSADQQLQDGQRRKALKATGALAASLAAGLPLSVFAQQAKIRAVMPNVFIPDPVRPIITSQSGGVEVDNLPYVSPSDSLAKLMAPGGTSQYDMIITLTNFAKGPALGARPGNERILALDMNAIPNASGISKDFQSEVVRRDGKTYMLPIVNGFESVIFDASKINPEDPLTQSWNVLFSDKYRGRIAWRDDAHGMIFTAALAMGISDPLSMQPAQVREVQKFLIDRKKNVRTMWTKFAEAVNMIATGEVYCLYGWIPMRAALERQGLKASNNWPREGLPSWTQSAFIPKDSKQAAATHKVINAMLSAEFGRKLTDVTEYPSTNGQVAASYDKAFQTKLGFDVASRGVRRISFELPQQMDVWLEAWNNVKAA